MESCHVDMKIHENMKIMGSCFLLNKCIFDVICNNLRSSVVSLRDHKNSLQMSYAIVWVLAFAKANTFKQNTSVVLWFLH